MILDQRSDFLPFWPKSTPSGLWFPNCLVKSANLILLLWISQNCMIWCRNQLSQFPLSHLFWFSINFIILDTLFSSTAVAKSVQTPCPLFAKERFGAQNAFWGPKTPFSSFFAFPRPKMHFWGHFAPSLKRLIKQTVSGAFFLTLGAKNGKWAHFSTYCSKSIKWPLFFDFGAQKWKNDSIFAFWLQECEKGATKSFVS